MTFGTASYFFIHVFAGGVSYAGIPHSGCHHKRQTDSRGEDISAFSRQQWPHLWNTYYLRSLLQISIAASTFNSIFCFTTIA